MSGPPCELCHGEIAAGAVATPTGFRHASCPKSGKSNIPLIVAGVGCASILILAVTVFAFLAIWQFLSPTPPIAGGDAGAGDPLSQSFATKNGLVTVHYPATFAASTPSEHVVSVQRTSKGGVEYVVIDAIDKPISEHLEEVDRLVRLELVKELASFVASPAKPGTCHGEPGIASGGSYEDGGHTYELRACSFMKDGNYHRCAYAAPRAALASNEALFKQICARVDLRAPAGR